MTLNINQKDRDHAKFIRKQLEILCTQNPKVLGKFFSNSPFNLLEASLRCIGKILLE